MEKSKKPSTKLVLAYNAKSGFFNGLSDSVHKIVSPSTYSCDLCAITHHSIGMRYPWKVFLEGLNMELEFVHTDEIEKYPYLVKSKFPLIGVLSEGRFVELLCKEELSQMKSIKELREATLKSLKGAGIKK
jgi:hypothetical protein